MIAVKWSILTICRDKKVGFVPVFAGVIYAKSNRKTGYGLYVAIVGRFDLIHREFGILF